MTKSYIIKCNSRYKNSITSLLVEASAEKISFTEQMQMPDCDTIHTGRTLVMEDVGAFEDASGYSLDELDDYLTNRLGCDKLNLEYLHRLCERKFIPYRLGGERLTTAYNRYLKTARSASDERLHLGRALFAKGLAAMLDPNVDKEMIADLFRQAIANGFLPAYSELANMYLSIGNEAKALEIYDQGIKAGDVNSIAQKATILTEKSSESSSRKAVYKKAATEFLKAAERGYITGAAEGIGRLMEDNEYTPSADIYMKIIALSAKSRRIAKEEEWKHVPEEADLQQAHRLLTQTPVHPAQAYTILNDAFSQGRLEACPDLYTACNKLECYAEAARCTAKGALNGITECYYNMAQLYHKGADMVLFSGNFAKPNYAKAAVWCVKAIEAGDMRGAERLNSYYKRGIHINYETMKTETETNPQPDRAMMYIHGFMSGARGSKPRQLRSKYGEQFRILAPELTADPDESLAKINKMIEEYKPEIIIGTSLGGWMAMACNAGDAKVVVVNPCTEPQQQLARWIDEPQNYFCDRLDGVQTYTLTQEVLDKYKAYPTAEDLMKDADNFCALCSTADELLGRRHIDVLLPEFGSDRVTVVDDFGHQCTGNGMTHLHQILADLIR